MPVKTKGAPCAASSRITNHHFHGIRGLICGSMAASLCTESSQSAIGIEKRIRSRISPVLEGITEEKSTADRGSHRGLASREGCASLGSVDWLWCSDEKREAGGNGSSLQEMPRTKQTVSG